MSINLSARKIEHMKALSDERGVIAAAAMDQRGSLQKSIAAAKGISKDEVTDAMMSEFKTAVSSVLTPHASAILLDPQWGLEAAEAHFARIPQKSSQLGRFGVFLQSSLRRQRRGPISPNSYSPLQAVLRRMKIQEKLRLRRCRPSNQRRVALYNNGYPRSPRN